MMVTGVCLLDIKKCFDTIDHTILVQKLMKYGVSGLELAWFTSYLDNRGQHVYCNNELSKIRTVNIGVPQGSILGPVLFLVYVNDLSQNISQGTCNLYADDTLIYTHAKTVTEVNQRLQECINEALIWYELQNLCLNADKSHILLISSVKNQDVQMNDPLHVTLGDVILEQKENAKYLGVFIDEHLKWDKQFSTVCRNLGTKISRLRRLRGLVPRNVLNTICKTCIFPSFDYACTVWGYSTIKNRNSIQRLQNYAARIVTSNFDYVNYRGIDIVKQLNWQTFDDRLHYFTSLLMFKCIHGMVPSYLSDQVVMACDVHGVNTRLANSMNVVVPFARTKCFENSLVYKGAVTWNQLPLHIKEATSLNMFRNRYKRYFMNVK